MSKCQNGLNDFDDERVQLILIGTKTPSGSKAWWATVGTDKYVQSNELFKFWKIPQMILDRGGGGGSLIEYPWPFHAKPFVVSSLLLCPGSWLSTLGPSMRSHLPFLPSYYVLGPKFKQGNEGGHIFQKRKKKLLIYSYKGRKKDHFGLKT